ncbi:diaminopimelate decarboxylase [Salinicoccus siamensis]|uniref:Diaminopimelate decarboxylase n=1 Tax=Salinicoccus siamensis TaxID=381830 RepID=A0ABV5Z146_9STAP
MMIEYVDNELQIKGHPLSEVADKYGTPLFIYDEDEIRENCRRYHHALQKDEIGYSISYASKAFTSIQLVRLLREENMKMDVVSAGELYTALAGGMPAEDIHFHGNNKTREEIEYALSAGVGLFVVDALDEVALIDDIAQHPVQVLLRVNPGVDVDTHSYIQTGQADSKFGLSISNGSALEAIKEIKHSRNLEFKGLHYHLGSQLTEIQPFIDAMEMVLRWLKETDIQIEVLNMGGGYGIKYTEKDDRFPIEEAFEEIINKLKNLCRQYSMALPHIMIEPGRSIVAEAGATLYETGVVKEIPGVSRYVSIDGGMSDHLRTALYGAEYTVLPVKKEEGKEIRSHIVGKLCESGDVISKDIALPENITRGDLLVVKSTGAYHYSMASNYNQMRKPAVVFISDEGIREIIKRQALAQLIENDVT